MRVRGVYSSIAVCTAAMATVILSGIPASAQNGSADPGSADMAGGLLPPGFPCLRANVYPFLSGLWGPLDGGAPRYAVGTEASGDGYLDMYAPPGGRTNYYHPGINTPLRDLTGPQSLGFMHRGQYVSFHLRLRLADRTDTDRSGFTTLVWWPSANGNAGATDWATSNDLGSGQWWSTQPIAGLAGGQQSTATLQAIAEANPRAIVTEYGVMNDNGTGGADKVVYGCATWDFEPRPSGSG